MKPTVKIIALSLFFVLTAICFSRSIEAFSDEDFNQAVELYKDAQYKEATHKFESLIRQGYSSAAIYYNLGNSFYQIGSTGKAIWAFEKARLLDPRDSDIEWNLSLLRKQLTDKPEGQGFSIIGWFANRLRPFRSNELAFIFSFGCGLLFLSLMAYLVWVSNRKPLRRLISLMAVIVLIAFMGVVVRWNELRNAEAIIIDREVYARYGPSPEATRAFLLHEGTKVALVTESGSWWFIQFDEKQKGWLPKEAVLNL